MNLVFQNSQNLLRRVLSEDRHDAIEELSVYLEDSFGNATRIDYGTGHEMAFVMLLCAFFKVGCFHKDDHEAAGLVLFNE